MDRLSHIESRRQQLEETENKGKIERLKIIENNLKKETLLMNKLK